MKIRSIPLSYPECLKRHHNPFLVMGYVSLGVSFQGQTGIKLGIIRAVDSNEPPLLEHLLVLNRIIGLTPVKRIMYPEASDFTDVMYALVKLNSLFAGRGYILTAMPNGAGVRKPEGIEYKFDLLTGGIIFPRRKSRDLPSLIPLGYDVIMGYPG